MVGLPVAVPSPSSATAALISTPTAATIRTTTLAQYIISSSAVNMVIMNLP